MGENLMNRLEAAVARLEGLSAGGLRQGVAAEDDGAAAAMDVAFGDLISQSVGRVTSAAEKIGGQVLDVSKIIAEAFTLQEELFIKIKQTQRLAYEIFFLAARKVGSSTDLIVQKVEYVHDIDKRDCLVNLLRCQEKNMVHAN